MSKLLNMMMGVAWVVGCVYIFHSWPWDSFSCFLASSLGLACFYIGVVMPWKDTDHE